MSYRPAEPFTTVVELFKPVYKTVKGVTVKDWETAGFLHCSFKTFGGTESVVNDQLIAVDTANIETWYRPGITSASMIKLGAKSYEIVGEPEDIEQRHQFLKFKVQAVRGGA